MALTQEDNLILQSYSTVCLLIDLKNNNFLLTDYFKEMKPQDQFTKVVLPLVGIDNQGFFIMAFYAMLVIPKELLFNKFPGEFLKLNSEIDRIKSKETNSTYLRDKDINGVDKIDYIKHIRNAVSHGRVEFSPNDFVIFTDENPHKNEICTIKIPLQHIDKLLTALQNLILQYLKALK